MPHEPALYTKKSVNWDNKRGGAAAPRTSRTKRGAYHSHQIQLTTPRSSLSVAYVFKFVNSCMNGEDIAYIYMYMLKSWFNARHRYVILCYIYR